MKHATRTMASTIGVICGLSGLEHGFFEILQGNITPEIHSISGRQMIYAIGEANRFWANGFEYAYTIIPNYLITGILVMIVSLLVIVWSALFIDKKAGWLVLILLSFLQYLVGGGAAQLGPAVIVGLAAILINHPLKLHQEFVRPVLGLASRCLLDRVLPFHRHRCIWLFLRSERPGGDHPDPVWNAVSYDRPTSTGRPLRFSPRQPVCSCYELEG